VKQKAVKLRAEITAEALNFVAERFRKNVRELEGALNCLSTYHHMTGKRVGVTAARRVLADLERDCIRVVRMSDVDQVVSRFFGVDVADLKSPKRHRSVSRPRMLAMFLARKLTQAAYSEIGDHFGGRNHSTVMSAERNVKAWLKQGTAINVASQAWPLEDVLETLEQQLFAG
jgi:chromosomal replication initiator protein